jgi:hypothetical protein
MGTRACYGIIPAMYQLASVLVHLLQGPEGHQSGVGRQARRRRAVGRPGSDFRHRNRGYSFQRLIDTVVIGVKRAHGRQKSAHL